MKRTKFEEILDSDFRWPTAGDAPFVADPDPAANANIASDDLARFVFMTEGYKKAADLMIDRTQAEPLDRDYLVCPIIFNYRQFIELSLKYMLAIYGPTVGADPNWKSHDLVDLWEAFAELLNCYGTSDPDVADPVVVNRRPKGPPIGVQKGPPSSSCVTGMAGVPFALVAA